MSNPRITEEIARILGPVLAKLDARLGARLAAWKASPWAFPLRSPQLRLVGSFVVLILIGTLLLSMPFAHQTGCVQPLDALFTATSAVCVTGLIVVQTGKDFTLAGQFIILMLIQIGGLGIMTFGALAFKIIGRRMSLQAQAMLQDTFFQEDASAQFKHLFKRILRLTLFIELFGMIALFLCLLPGHTWGHALYSAAFHSISAFCNAGFSLYAESLIPLRGRHVLIIVVMVLIILGGLGHTVLYELWQYLMRIVRRKRTHHASSFSLHARLVFWTSGVLIVVGVVGLLLMGLTPRETTPTQKVFAALFQSVTARTAGFNTVDVGSLHLGSLFLIVLLMFVGGSPGSCAGGIKTTTLAIFVAGFKSSLLGQSEVRMLGRRIPVQSIQRVMLLFAMAVVWNIVGIMLLLATESDGAAIGMHDVVFEQISAFGTVGLSTGLTPHLSTAGRLWIILTMFVGRLGPLTLALWIFRKSAVNVRYPEGKVMIG